MSKWYIVYDEDLVRSQGSWKDHLYSAKEWINGKWRYIYNKAVPLRLRNKSAQKKAEADLRSDRDPYNRPKVKQKMSFKDRMNRLYNKAVPLRLRNKIAQNEAEADLRSDRDPYNRPKVKQSLSDRFKSGITKAKKKLNKKRIASDISYKTAKFASDAKRKINKTLAPAKWAVASKIGRTKNAISNAINEQKRKSRVKNYTKLGNKSIKNARKNKLTQAKSNYKRTVRDIKNRYS